jgi:hypothetical protein
VVFTGKGLSVSVLLWGSRFRGFVLDMVCISHRRTDLEISGQHKFSMLMRLAVYEAEIAKKPSVKSEDMCVYTTNWQGNLIRALGGPRLRST